MTQQDGEAVVERARLDDVLVALESLSATLDDGGELETALGVVCRHLTAVVPGADMASVTLVRDGSAHTAASTDDMVVEIDADQYAAGEGPCLHAASTGEVVRVDVADACERWPRFARGALAAGVASYLSAPLVVDSTHAGALNLYGLSAHGFRDVDGTVLELYVVAAETALRATSRYLTAREHAAQLTKALDSRAVIDQAKGIIMAARRIDAAEAFAVLVEQSQRENVKVRDLAERFVATVTSPAP